MFKILDGDYGNPPERCIWTLGTFDITPSEEAELINFNNRSDASDLVSVANDLTKIEFLKEKDFGKAKKEVVFMISTRVGNKFIARADKKSYLRILEQSNYYLETELKDHVEEEELGVLNDVILTLKKFRFFPKKIIS